MLQRVSDFNFITLPYIHNKTGNKYQVLTTVAIDCTNCRDGTPVVVYTDGKKIFVRESKEFFEKFSKDAYAEVDSMIN